MDGTHIGLKLLVLARKVGRYANIKRLFGWLFLLLGILGEQEDQQVLPSVGVLDIESITNYTIDGRELRLPKRNLAISRAITLSRRLNQERKSLPEGIIRVALQTHSERFVVLLEGGLLFDNEETFFLSTPRSSSQ